MAQRIGRFELRESLGEGAAGTFYRGFDPATGRDVTVQVIKLPSHHSLESREEALKQAKAAGAFSHPNVAAILDIGSDNDAAYVAREWVDGRSLAHVANESAPFRPSDIAGWLDQTADALDYAHRRGIVHGALEPSHVLVTPSGQIKVTGFGTAKVASKAAHDSHALEGAPEYMSPERVRGDAIDRRSDVYSLGAIAYELVTGMPPFASDSVVTTIFKVVNDPVRPPAVSVPDLSDEVDTAIMRALAKDPAERFDTCRAFVDAFRSGLEDGPLVTSVFCDQCGVALPPDAAVCSDCGARLGTADHVEPIAVSPAPAPEPAIAPEPVPEPEVVVAAEPTPAVVVVPPTERAPIPVPVPPRARGSVPPPLSAYAQSTGTPDLPPPGAPIEAPAKRPMFEGALPVVIIFAVLLALFVLLGLWVAPRVLAPAPAPARQTSRSIAGFDAVDGPHAAVDRLELGPSRAAKSA